MHLYIRSVQGEHTVEVNPNWTTNHLLQLLREREGASDTYMVFLGKRLDASGSLVSFGVLPGSTIVHMGRVRGGAPVQVNIIPKGQPYGDSVTVDITKDTSKLELKHKLEQVTGVPMESQKVMLSGINQLVMADKRMGLEFDYCGTASSIYFAVVGKETAKPAST